MPRLAIFTDLDGTLLDHDTYSHAPATPALTQLKALQIPLVLASSKTAAEIARLHDDLGLGDTPAIVENGAGLYRPGKPGDGDDDAYQRIRKTLSALPPDLRNEFQGFGDMGVDDIARITGLGPAAAQEAARRQHSEPGLWHGSDADQAAFIAALAPHGITARSGGRFLTLSFGATKADRLRDLAADLNADITIALGDAPNDREMIEAADYGVIIRNDHGPGLPPLAGEDTGRIQRTTAPGPTGWNTAVLSLVAFLTKGRQAT